MERIKEIGAIVNAIPETSEIPNLIAKIVRHWGELKLADEDLAIELAEKLSKASIIYRPE